MARLPKVPVEQWDPELIELTGAQTAAAVQLSSYQIFAHKPELAKAMSRYAAALWSQLTLPPRLLELVRLRVAMFNQCRMCLSVRYRPAIEDGMSEAVVCEIDNFEASHDLNEAEKASLHFATLMASDHLSIGQADYDRLLKHFSVAEVVELGVFIGHAIGGGRFQASLDNIDETGAAFVSPAIGTVAPWSGAAEIVG